MNKLLIVLFECKFFKEHSVTLKLADDPAHGVRMSGSYNTFTALAERREAYILMKF